MKKLLALVLSGVMLIGCLAGCSGGNQNNTANNTTQNNTSTNNTGDTGDTTASDEPVYGGTLKVAVNRSIAANALDPVYANGTHCDQVVLQYGQTLVEENAEATDYIPCLATEWTVSDDGLVYTFTIREGVHFQKGEYQDGREMTAEDVVYSLNRAHELSWWGYLPFFDHAELTEDGKVACYLESANATFLHELTSPSGIIIPQEEVDGQGEQFGATPIGTGPFQVVEHVPDQYTRLEKNPDYWGPEPYLDEVIYYVITDEAQTMNALNTGEIDAVLSVTGTNIQLVKDNPNLQLVQSPTNSIYYLGFNLSDPILSDQRVRDAIAMSIDREQVAAGTYTDGDGVVSYLPVPTTSWGYDEDLVDLVPEYDPEGAKALLEEAGYGDGLDLVLTIDESEAKVRAATVIQAQLSQVGINVQIDSLTSTEVTDRYLNNTVQLWIGGQSGSADPGTFVGNFLSTAKMHTNYNAFCYSDPETDEIIAQASAETDQSVREELYRQLIEIAIEDNIGVFYGTTYLSWGLNNRVHGFVQENKAVMKVCGLEGTGINIWVSE